MHLSGLREEVFLGGLAHLLIAKGSQGGLDMSRRSARRKGKAGRRFTPPQVRAAEIRDGSVYEDGFIGQVWRGSATDRLDLGGVEHQTIPRALKAVEYECDEESLTGFAGMPALMQFAYGVGLADWVAGLPLKRRRDAIYGPGKLCEVVVGLLAAGLERVSHVDDVKDDPGLCAALGLKRLPDQATLSRFFADVRPAAEEFLRAANRQFSEKSVTFAKRAARLIVDADTRTVGVYGKQEGTVCSPRNQGRPMYTFEVTTLRNGRDVLDGGLLKGATHPAPLFAERFATVLKQLAPHTRELVFCADAAWYADHILEAVEQADEDAEVRCACKYAIRAQIRGRLMEAIAALPESAWRRYDEAIEVAEVRFAFTQTRDADGKRRQRRDASARRYVVTRKQLADKDDPQSVLLPQPRYEYQAIVTSLDWKPKRVVACYNRRATVESILKENALGFHMDSLPSASWCGNAVFCQLLILAYNLVNLFRRFCLPEEASRQHVPALRRRLFAVPGRIEAHGSQCRIHCATVGPHVGWLAQVQKALRRWLVPPNPAPTLAGAG
jgi:hypothetical protein